jgi:hypothetical protein
MENATANDLDEQDHYRRAKARVASLRGFYVHLTIYLLVNAGLVTINMLTQHGVWWWYWPALGWGIGLVAHAAGVFVFPGFLGRDWEERKIKEIVSKQREL